MPAYTRIAVAPVPPLSGTAVTVREGDGLGLFPEPPFPALVWTPQDVPVLGESAERVTVTARNNDVLALTRAADPIEITGDMMLAWAGAAPFHDLGSSVTLTEQFSGNRAPYSLAVTSPMGSVTAFGTAALTHNGAGLVSFTFEPGRGGLWEYRFDGAGETGPARQIFVSL
jgi:hypothetical protein